MTNPDAASQFFQDRPSIEDRLMIEDMVTAIGMYLDSEEYDSILPLFTSDAVMSFAGAFGSDYSSMPVAEFMDYIRSFLPGFDGTQHRITNFDIKVSGDRATCRSHIYGSHFLDGKDWIAAATYHHEFIREGGEWRIARMGATFLAENEHRELMETAKQRVKAGFNRRRGA